MNEILAFTEKRNLQFCVSASSVYNSQTNPNKSHLNDHGHSDSYVLIKFLGRDFYGNHFE